MFNIVVYAPPIERLVSAYGVYSNASKQLVLSLGLDKVYNGLSRDLYKLETNQDFDTNSFLKTYTYFNNQPNLTKVCDNLNKARYKRSNRLEGYIEKMLKYGQCSFLTLTFRDDVLQATSEATRRQYVSRFLSMFSPYYIANIDYGGKNGREHYHAIIMHKKNIDLSIWRDKYGSIDIEPIRVKNAECLSKYMTKLTNHAIKDTGRSKRVIYSNRINDLNVKEYYVTQNAKLRQEIDKLQQQDDAIS